jgi:DNA invertase Pin-like site-specific DNA recombinase
VLCDEGCNLRSSQHDRSRPGSAKPIVATQEFATKLGWTIVGEYTDEATAKNGDRVGFKQLLADAAAHKFDVLLFWSLDRLTREGTFATLRYLRGFSDAGVKYKSYTEQYIDSLGPFGDAIIGILAAVAQQERIRISDRTKAGLARVKASGKHIGRPRARINIDKLRVMREAGQSMRFIAKQLHVSPALICKIVALAGAPRY